MKILVFQNCLLSPPTAYNHAVFLYAIANIKQSLAANFCPDAETIELIYSLLTYRSPVKLGVLSLEDWRSLILVLEDLVEPVEMKPIGEKNNNGFSPTLSSTGDNDNDLLGDLIMSLGEVAVELYFKCDRNSLLQINHRVNQWKYWQNPDNWKKGEDKVKKEKARVSLDKLMALKDAGKVRYSNEIGI